MNQIVEVSETLLLVCSHLAARGAGGARALTSVCPKFWVFFHHEEALEGTAVSQSVLVSSGSTVALKSRTYNGPSPSKLWPPLAVLGPAAEPSFPFSEAPLLSPQATDLGLLTRSPALGVLAD